MSNTTALTNSIPNLALACLCGCGRIVGKRSKFAPGHDAKFVSDQVFALVDQGGYTGDIQQAIDDRADLITSTVSAALGTKFYNAAMNRWAKMATEKAPKAYGAKDDVTEGFVKIGRWTYPAQRFMADGHTRMNINDCRDGSGDWLDAEGYNNKSQAYWLNRFEVK